MTSRLPDEALRTVFRLALGTAGLLGESDTAAIFYDLSGLAERTRAISGCFPATALHAIAVKANPLERVLERLALTGVGFEVASLPELQLALRAGTPAARIVFDSPAKTRNELRYALSIGCHINADSLCELDRISSIIGDECIAPTSSIGVRVNPQVGMGRILSTSVAGKYSKFGVCLGEEREALLDRFAAYNWLTGLHVHVGSQGCSMEMLLSGIARVLDFANEADRRLKSDGIRRRVEVFDIGGGLPVSYHQDQEPIPVMEYAAAIHGRFPDLFSSRFKLITEFGRYVHANCGWVASRVEYVKRGHEVNTAVIHVGADLFLRKCYRPDDWHHEIFVLDREGHVKKGVDHNPYVIAGPLCFAGDVLASGLQLPVVNEGDFVIIRDAGAYTLGMWSRYNSRQVPKVIGYTKEGGHFEVLREREDVERVLEFWQ